MPEYKGSAPSAHGVRKSVELEMKSYGVGVSEPVC